MHDIVRLARMLRMYDMSVNGLAKLLNISKQTAYNRANGISDFKSNEVATIAKKFSLSPYEVELIFFPDRPSGIKGY